MRAVFLTSLLLCLSSLVWAQPWGPWTIAQVPSGMSLGNPQVCLRNNDTADVFYQIADTIFHVTVDVRTGIIYPPTAFPMEGSGWSRRLCDVVATNEGWAALVYDATVLEHRTLLFEVRDGQASTLQIYSGYTWDPCARRSGTRNHGFALTARSAGGCIAGWQSMWGAYNPWPWPGWDEEGAGVAIYVSATDWPHNPFVENGYVGCWDELEQPQTALHYVSDDSILILELCPGEISILSVAEHWLGYGIAPVGYLNCPVRLIGSLFARNAGVLLLSGSSGSAPARLLRTDSLRICMELQILDDDPIAAASDPDYGIAWVAWHGPAILLYRADTTGVEYLPEGTVHWPDQNRVIAEAAVGMSHEGRIAAVWSERVPGSANATRLRMKSLNWETPLAARDRAFILPPSSFILSAYPNPFNSTLKIEYALPKAGNVELSVFNVLGQKVETLVAGRVESGTHAVTWNPKCAGGVYFVTLKTETEARTTKVLFLR